MSAISRSSQSTGSKSRNLDPTLGGGNQAHPTAQVVTNEQASEGDLKLDASTLVDTLLMEGARRENPSYLTEPTSIQHTADATSSSTSFAARGNGRVTLGSQMDSAPMRENIDLLESLDGAFTSMQSAEMGNADFANLWWFGSDNITGIHATQDVNDVNHPNNANRADIWDMV